MSKKKVETVTFYHGTCESFRPAIEAGGIKSSRKSGYVFIANEERASVYGACWSIAMHALGVAPSRRGIVIACRVPADAPVSQVQACEFAIDPKHLTLDSIREVEFHPTDLETLGWVFQFVGVVSGYLNEHLHAEPYKTWGDLGVKYLKRFPDAAVSEALMRVPCF